MSMIHRSCVRVGCSSRLIDGTARCRTVRSITYSRHASARTESPIHSRLVAFAGAPRAPGRASAMSDRCYGTGPDRASAWVAASLQLEDPFAQSRQVLRVVIRAGLADPPGALVGL